MLYWVVVCLKVSLCLLLYSLSIWRLVPVGLLAYERWHQEQETKDLAHLILCAVFIFVFLFFVGSAVANLASVSDDFFSCAYGIARLGCVIGLTFFISYYSAPKTVQLFHKWKETRQTKYFSRMTLMGSLSLYAFLFILTLFIPHKIGF